MADLTSAEQGMFSRWWGVKDLHVNDEFWTEVLLFYQDKNVALPVAYTPQSVRYILDKLECPVGKCALCCRYDELPVNAEDLKRIEEKSEWGMEELGDLVKAKADRSTFIVCSDGCPFLKENACTIYECRPSACYFFPLNTPRMATLNGQEFQQAVLRVKCLSSVNIVRRLMTDALAEGGMLLPDLSLVGPNKEES